MTLCASSVDPSAHASVTSTKSCLECRSRNVEATLTVKSFHFKLYFWVVPILRKNRIQVYVLRLLGSSFPRSWKGFDHWLFLYCWQSHWKPPFTWAWPWIFNTLSRTEAQSCNLKWKWNFISQISKEVFWGGSLRLSSRCNEVHLYPNVY